MVLHALFPVSERPADDAGRVVAVVVVVVPLAVVAAVDQRESPIAVDVDVAVVVGEAAAPAAAVAAGPHAVDAGGQRDGGERLAEEGCKTQTQTGRLKKQKKQERTLVQHLPSNGDELCLKKKKKNNNNPSHSKTCRLRCEQKYDSCSRTTPNMNHFATCLFVSFF